ncbi:(2Fe-2S)-binding protein [Mycobacterium sp. NPDC003449]
MDIPDLRAVAGLGEFFALPEVSADPSWAPVMSLLGDASAVHRYALAARSAIAAGMAVEAASVPLKAAASSVHLSIVARLLSPAIGAAGRFGAVPMLTPETLFWQPTSSHRPALGAGRVSWAPATDPRRAAAAIVDPLIADVLAPFNETMRQAVSLSPRVMWGNIASAAHGAVTVLTRACPESAGRARGLVAALIATDPLTGSAGIVDGRFRRRNCCLFYQVPGGGYCGDCVLVDG